MTASQSPSMRALSVTDPTVTRDEAIDMLHLAIGFIQRGKHEVAIAQIHFLIDNLEVATAIDEMLIARDYGCSEHFLCQ